MHPHVPSDITRTHAQTVFSSRPVRWQTLRVKHAKLALPRNFAAMGGKRGKAAPAAKAAANAANVKIKTALTSEANTLHMGKLYTDTMKTMALRKETMKPMSPDYLIKIADTYAYLFSQPGCESLSTAMPFGTVAGESSAKATLTTSEIVEKLATHGIAETSWNAMSLNPFWTAVNNVPTNTSNVNRLKNMYAHDLSKYEQQKFICLCPGDTKDPSTAMGDIKVLSPLEPLHAMALCFVDELKEGMSEVDFAKWIRLIRSTTVVFKDIAQKQDCFSIVQNTHPGRLDPPTLGPRLGTPAHIHILHTVTACIPGDHYSFPEAPRCPRTDWRTSSSLVGCPDCRNYPNQARPGGDNPKMLRS